MASLGEAVVEVGADTSGFKNEVQKGVTKATDSAASSAAKSMQNLGKGFSKAGTKMSLGITAPIVAIGTAAIRTGMDFEQSMNRVSAITGTTGKGLDALTDQAIQLGADTAFSAKEAAEGMQFLGMAGFRTNEIMDALPGTMDLAAASATDLGTSADIMSNILSGFGANADKAGKFADVLAKTTSSANTDMQQLGDAMKYVAPVAATAGVSLEETAAVIGKLSDAGIQGSMAGTTLRGSISALLNPTPKAKKALEALGVSATDGSGNLRSMVDIVDQLAKSGADTADYMNIFGQRAGPGMAALVQAGAPALAGLQKELENAGGTAEKMANTQLQGAAGAMEQLSGSIESLSIAFVNSGVLDFFADIVTRLTEFVNKLTQTSPQIMKYVAVFAVLAAAIGPVLIVTGMLITAVGTIVGVFAGLTAAVLAPIAAFTLLAVGVGLLLAKSEKARDVVTGAFEEIKTAVLSAVGPIVDMVQGQLIPAFMDMWPALETIGVIVLKVFAGAVVGAIKGAINVIQGVVQVITGVVQVVSGILSGDWSRVWEGMKNIVGGALNAIKGAIQVWLNVGLLSLFRRGFGLLKGILTGGWNTAKSLFTKGIAGLRTVTSKVGQILTAPFRIAFNVLRAVVSAGWNFIKGIFTNTLATLRGVVSGGMGSIRSILSNGLSALRGIASNAMNGFRSAISNGFNTVMTFVKGIPGKIKGAFGDAAGWLKSAGMDIVRGLGAGIESMYDWVRGKIDALSGWIPGWVKKKLGIASPSKVMAELGVWVAKGLAEGIGSTMPVVASAVASTVAVIQNGFKSVEVGPAVTNVTETFTAIAEGITAATEEQVERQKKAYEKDVANRKKAYEKDAAERKKALEKKYGGKDEKKRLKKELAELESETKKHLRKLDAEQRKAIRELEKGGKSASASLIALANTNRNAILSQAESWDAMATQLEGVREAYDNALSDLRSKTDEMESLSARIRDSLISSVFKTDEKVPPTFAGIIASLEEQESAAERYGKIMEQLAGLGLNPTSFQQIADAGVDGLAAAEALLASGQAGVNQVNALQSSINAYAEKAGDTVANYLLGAGVALAQSTVDSFAAQESTLVAQMTTLGQAIATAFQEAIRGVSLPAAAQSGGGGGRAGNSKHQWVPIGKNNRKCQVCGKARSANVHTNRNDNNASGTLSAAGGWSKVGERGPELVRLPAGSRVYPAQQSERMAGGKDKPPAEIHVHMPTGDPEAAAMAVMNRFVRGL